jgi:hypothetical protein
LIDTPGPLGLRPLRVVKPQKVAASAAQLGAVLGFAVSEHGCVAQPIFRRAERKQPVNGGLCAVVVLVYGLMADRPPRAFIRRGSCLKEFRVTPGTQRCSPPVLSVAATVSRLVEGANVHGVTELFPLSSLGHWVLLPALAGGHGLRT